MASSSIAGETGLRAWFTHSENEPLSFTPENPAISDASEADAVALAPMLVTDNLNSALIARMRYWPSDVVDAEQKKAWISFEPPEHRRLYSIDDGGNNNSFMFYQTRPNR